jgi:hypothetical protein
MSLKKELAREAARILLCTVDQKLEILKETYKGDTKIQRTLQQVHDEIFDTGDEDSFGDMIEQEIMEFLQKKKIEATTNNEGS